VLETVNIFCQYTVELGVIIDTLMLTSSFSAKTEESGRNLNPRRKWAFYLWYSA
jgi:hypothetical protein